MSLDDPIQVHLRQAKEEIDDNVERDLSAATVAGLLSLIPGVGSAIASLLNGRADRIIQRRWITLFEHLKERVEEIRDSIHKSTYYSSEEFLTLLVLAREQLLTTHDHKKQKMLAAALANSGAAQFIEDNLKEQYMRTLRELSPPDLNIFGKLKPTPSGFPKIADPVDEERCSLTRLSAFGLVTETLELEQPLGGGIAVNGNIVTEWPTKPPQRVYHISSYGRRFVEYFSGTHVN